MVDLCSGHSLTVLVIMLRGQHVHQPHPVYVERGRRTLAFPFRGQRQPESLVPAKALIVNVIKMLQILLRSEIHGLPRLCTGHNMILQEKSQRSERTCAALPSPKARCTRRGEHPRWPRKSATCPLHGQGSRPHAHLAPVEAPTAAWRHRGPLGCGSRPRLRAPTRR